MDDLIKAQMLQNIDTILGIDSDYDLENLYLQRAIDFVVTYCNFVDDTQIPTVLYSVIEDIVVYRFRSRGVENLTQEVQGARQSYFVSDLPPHLASQLNRCRKVKIL